MSIIYIIIYHVNSRHNQISVSLKMYLNKLMAEATTFQCCSAFFYYSRLLSLFTPYFSFSPRSCTLPLQQLRKDLVHPFKAGAAWSLMPLRCVHLAAVVPLTTPHYSIAFKNPSDFSAVFKEKPQLSGKKPVRHEYVWLLCTLMKREVDNTPENDNTQNLFIF